MLKWLKGELKCGGKGIDYTPTHASMQKPTFFGFFLVRIWRQAYFKQCRCHPLLRLLHTLHIKCSNEGNEEQIIINLKITLI